MAKCLILMCSDVFSIEVDVSLCFIVMIIRVS